MPITTWLEHARDITASEIANLLGLEEGKPSSGLPSFSCPACGAPTRHTKSNDKRGAIGLTTNGLGWRCFQCDASGDSIDLVSYSISSYRFTEANEVDKENVRDWYADRWPAWFDDSVRTNHDPASSHPSPSSSAKPNYPPPEEIEILKMQCVRLSDAPELSAQLKQTRGIDPLTFDELGCGIALTGSELPKWAKFRGESRDHSEPWTKTGHTLIVPLFDASGILRSIVARRLSSPSRQGDPKSLPPTGFSRSGLLFANHTAREMLQSGEIPKEWPKNEAFRVVICEGEMDWASWCVHSEITTGDAQEALSPAIIGIISGSWTPELAARVPSGSEVIIRNHRDASGEGVKYAEKIHTSLGGRCQVYWLGPSTTGEDMPDDNDLLQAGTLPEDPAVGTIPMDEGLLMLAPTLFELYGLEDLERDKHRELISMAQLPTWPVTLADGRDTHRWPGHGWGDHLNHVLGGGLEPGEFIGIGASSAGAGKTAFLMQLADGLALRSLEIIEGSKRWGHTLTPVVMLSEMPPRLLTRRSIARWAGFSHTLLRKYDEGNEIRREAWQRARSALHSEQLGKARKMTRMVKLEHWAQLPDIVRSWLMTLSRQYPHLDIVPIVVVDPIQRCISGERPEIEEMKIISDRFRAWTDEGGWITLITSDTNKTSASNSAIAEDWSLIEEGTAAFRGSYRLVHDLDTAIYLKKKKLTKDDARGLYYIGSNSFEFDEMKAIVVKTRNGSQQVPWPKFKFIGSVMRFEAIIEDNGNGGKRYESEDDDPENRELKEFKNQTSDSHTRSKDVNAW